MLCVPHLGATENWTIEQPALMHATIAESTGELRF